VEAPHPADAIGGRQVEGSFEHEAMRNAGKVRQRGGAHRDRRRQHDPTDRALAQSPEGPQPAAGGAVEDQAPTHVRQSDEGSDRLGSGKNRGARHRA